MSSTAGIEPWELQVHTLVGDLRVRSLSASRVMISSVMERPLIVNGIQVAVAMAAVKQRDGTWKLVHGNPEREHLPWTGIRARRDSAGRYELPASTAQKVKAEVEPAVHAWLDVSEHLLRPELANEWEALRERLVHHEVEAAKIRQQFADADINPYGD